MEIVIIDDNVDLCEILRQALSIKGHTSFIATQGDTGFAIIIEKLPDAVICDIDLPGLDGHAIAKTIRSANRRLAQLPLVAISGFSRDIDRQKAIEAGFNFVLAKPIELDDLNSVLGEVEQIVKAVHQRSSIVCVKRPTAWAYRRCGI